MIPRTTRTSIRQGDTAPALQAHLMDGDVPVPLTSATAVTMHARRVGKAGSEISAPAEIGPEVGSVIYRWKETDTAEAGDLQVTFKVTWADGTTQTFPGSGFVVVTVTPAIQVTG